MVNSEKIQNNVTFKVGDNIMNESFKDSFHACYFIEQSPFTIIESEINGVKRDKAETQRFTDLVAPTEYMASLKKTIEPTMQEILGLIAWYQDMLDSERMREAEKMYASEKVFATDMKF